jgi:SAM-dependent methyltransferase
MYQYQYQNFPKKCPNIRTGEARSLRLRGVGGTSTLDTYESFAPIYNAFNHRNNYEVWLGRLLLPELAKHGLRTGRALDVGCGTGRAFAPLLRRGWKVHGCDLSPSMLAQALREGGGKVDVDLADMRELPTYGEFKLVLSLNDTVNYLLNESDLQRALTGMRDNLAQGGLVLFDVNSRETYEGGGIWASGSRTIENGDRSWTWRAIGEVKPSIYEVRIEGDDVEAIVHRQRFYSQLDVREALAASGLHCRAVLGMEESNGEIFLSVPADENRHIKLIYIAARHNDFSIKQNRSKGVKPVKISTTAATFPAISTTKTS